MKIIGCDFHPSYQQIARVATETGELWEGRLEHEQGEARRFYEALQGQQVRVGMEAVGNAQWFERMLAALGQSCGLEMRRRSDRWWCGGRRPTGATRGIFCSCCSTGGFRGCGCRVPRCGMCGSCCGTGRSWWSCARRGRT